MVIVCNLQTIDNKAAEYDVRISFLVGVQCKFHHDFYVIIVFFLRVNVDCHDLRLARVYLALESRHIHLPHMSHIFKCLRRHKPEFICIFFEFEKPKRNRGFYQLVSILFLSLNLDRGSQSAGVSQAKCNVPIPNLFFTGHFLPVRCPNSPTPPLLTWPAASVRI